MSNLYDYNLINNIIERLEKRKILFPFADEFTEINMTEMVAELKPATPTCNTQPPGSPPKYFNCSVGQGGFGCSATSLPGYDCNAPEANNIFSCKSVFNECPGNVKPHACNAVDYSNNCTITTNPSLFECGTHECKASQASPNAGFECKNGYGCNANTYSCSGKSFACSGTTMNFLCFGKNDCDKDFDCGGSSSKFNCIGETNSDSFTCKTDFTCTNGQVQCVQGRYSCNASVACNSNGQGYTPPQPGG